MHAADALARPTLDTVAAAYAAVVRERQVRLDALIGHGEWSADLAERRLVVGGRRFTVALLASTTDATDTWQWAWNAPVYGPDHPAVAPTAALTEIGRRCDVPELATGQLRLSGVYDAGHGPGHTLAIAACGLLAADAYYPAPYDGGTAWLLLTDDALAPSPPTSAGAIQVLSAAVGLYPHHNRLTVETYAAIHDLPGTDDGDRLRLQFSDGAATFSFDELDRLTDVATN